MSTTTTSSTKKVKLPKSKKSPDASSYHPISSCGPLDNQFLEFYAELYQSALLFSDYKFQQKLLFPFPTAHSQYSQYHTRLPKNLRDFKNFSPNCNNTNTSTNTKRNVRKAQRRLSEGSRDRESRRRSPLSLNFSDTSGLKGITILTSTPTKGNTNTKKIRRRVSFSRNSPRSNSNQNSPHHHEGLIPSITIQEDCWSSDLDESDTTETEKASSTVGDDEVSSDAVFRCREKCEEAEDFQFPDQLSERAKEISVEMSEQGSLTPLEIRFGELTTTAQKSDESK